jgi:hypothetical protein
MLIAEVDGIRVQATPKSSGVCPLCRVAVVAKCGRINVWHWAHTTLKECDPWYQPESQWHLNWKKLFPIEWTEVVMPPHRADVRLPDGTVIEFQHSPIDVEELQEREEFYGKQSMIWIFDKAEVWWAGRQSGFNDVEKRFTVEDGGCINGYPASKFKWLHPHKSVWHSTAHVYLDFGNDVLFKIHEITSHGPPTYGIGYWRIKPAFVEELLERKDFKVSP